MLSKQEARNAVWSGSEALRCVLERCERVFALQSQWLDESPGQGPPAFLVILTKSKRCSDVA